MFLVQRIIAKALRRTTSLKLDDPVQQYFLRNLRANPRRAYAKVVQDCSLRTNSIPQKLCLKMKSSPAHVLVPF